MKNIASSCQMTVWNGIHSQVSAAGEPVLSSTGAEGLPSVPPGCQQHGSPSARGLLHHHNTLASRSPEAPHSACSSSPPPISLAAFHTEHSRSTAHSIAEQSQQSSWDSQASPGAGRVPLDSSHDLQMEIMLGQVAAQTPRAEPSPEASMEKHHHQNLAKTQPKLNSLSLLRGAGPCLLWCLQTEQFCRRKLLQRCL